MSLVTRDYENYSYSIFFDDLVKLKSRQLRKHVGTITLNISEKNDMSFEYDPTNILHYTTMPLNNDCGDSASNISIGIDTDHLMYKTVRTVPHHCLNQVEIDQIS